MEMEMMVFIFIEAVLLIILGFLAKNLRDKRRVKRSGEKEEA